MKRKFHFRPPGNVTLQNGHIPTPTNELAHANAHCVLNSKSAILLADGGSKSNRSRNNEQYDSKTGVLLLCDTCINSQALSIHTHARTYETSVLHPLSKSPVLAKYTVSFGVVVDSASCTHASLANKSLANCLGHVGKHVSRRNCPSYCSMHGGIQVQDGYGIWAYICRRLVPSSCRCARSTAKMIK